MTSHHVICHVTAVSYASSSSKRKEKENKNCSCPQYSITVSLQSKKNPRYLQVVLGSKTGPLMEERLSGGGLKAPCNL